MTILDSEYFKDLIRIVPSQFIVCQSFAEKFKYFFFKDDEIRDYLFHAISYQKVGLNQNLPAEFNLEFKYSTLNRWFFWKRLKNFLISEWFSKISLYFQ